MNTSKFHLKSRNGAPPKGYKGGKPYGNNPKPGAQKLPEGVNYREYDINPKIPGVDRGDQRLVFGDDGSAWVTEDHYTTFTQLL